jgi:16S rRNA (guanine527-N7)-methyltransferase
MDRLLSYVEPYFGAHTKGLFLKGKQADEELTKAMKKWKLEVSRVPSITSNTGVIVVVEKILSEPE